MTSMVLPVVVSTETSKNVIFSLEIEVNVSDTTIGKGSIENKASNEEDTTEQIQTQTQSRQQQECLPSSSAASSTIPSSSFLSRINRYFSSTNKSTSKHDTQQQSNPLNKVNNVQYSVEGINHDDDDIAIVRLGGSSPLTDNIHFYRSIQNNDDNNHNNTEECPNNEMIQSQSTTTICDSIDTSKNTIRYGAIFCHRNIVEMALHTSKINIQDSNRTEDCADNTTTKIMFPFTKTASIVESDNINNNSNQNKAAAMFSHNILSRIHPFLANNFTVRTVITGHNTQYVPTSSTSTVFNNLPADVILIDLSHTPEAVIHELLEIISHQQTYFNQRFVNNNSIIETNDIESNLILKLVLLESVAIIGDCMMKSKSIVSTTTNTPKIEIPHCPVCLHRIEPTRIGYPRLLDNQICSKFYCPTVRPYDKYTSDMFIPCPRQRLLRPWPRPNFCPSCHIIDEYNTNYITNGIYKHNRRTGSTNKSSTLVCSTCSMQETLWVCLTCAFVGCGRYSNKHAEQHYTNRKHPYCLELSTGRIWSYVDSEYIHRLDLLECPCSFYSISSSMLSRATAAVSVSTVSAASSSSSPATSCTPRSIDTASLGSRLIETSKPPPISGSTNVDKNEGMLHDQNNNSVVAQHAAFGDSESNVAPSSSNVLAGSSAYISDSYSESVNGSAYYSEVEVEEEYYKYDKSQPHKASMIGEEYEALLQSALEEQAHYYEGEIKSLWAHLTAQQVDQNTISVAEQEVIDELRVEIQHLKTEIDTVMSKELLKFQAQEAGQRATSQRLLQEQRIVQDLIRTIRAAVEKEHNEYQIQVQELEYQIDDLTANQKMRYQFETNDELANAQVLVPHVPTAVTAVARGGITQNNLSTTGTDGPTTTTTSKSSGKKGSKNSRTNPTDNNKKKGFLW